MHLRMDGHHADGYIPRIYRSGDKKAHVYPQNISKTPVKFQEELLLQGTYYLYTFIVFQHKNV